MFNTRSLSPTTQKSADSSTYWQFFYYRPPGKFRKRSLRISCQEPDMYRYYRYKQFDNRYGFSISIGNTSHWHWDDYMIMYWHSSCVCWSQTAQRQPCHLKIPLRQRKICLIMSDETREIISTTPKFRYSSGRVLTEPCLLSMSWKMI